MFNKWRAITELLNILPKMSLNLNSSRFRFTYFLDTSAWMCHGYSKLKCSKIYWSTSSLLLNLPPVSQAIKLEVKILPFYCLSEFLFCPLLAITIATVLVQVSNFHIVSSCQPNPCSGLQPEWSFKEKNPWISLPFLIPLSVFSAIRIEFIYKMTFKILQNLPFLAFCSLDT